MFILLPQEIPRGDSKVVLYCIVLLRSMPVSGFEPGPSQSCATFPQKVNNSSDSNCSSPQQLLTEVGYIHSLFVSGLSKSCEDYVFYQGLFKQRFSNVVIADCMKLSCGDETNVSNEEKRIKESSMRSQTYSFKFVAWKCVTGWF